jgi:cellulose synthase (UDP-forming)
MLIAFIAFVICFELPRDDRFYPINEAGALRLAGDNNEIPCRIESLSTSAVELSWTTTVRAPPDEGTQYCLLIKQLGAVAVTVAATTSKTAIAKLHLTFEQRRRLVIWQFGSTRGDIAETVRVVGVIMGLFRRGFRGR